MACYISTNNNRFYVALEQQFGDVAAITAAERIAGIQLRARQQTARVERRDKSGSRTFQGLPAGLRRQTNYILRSYLSGWDRLTNEPAQGPLFRSALGGTPMSFAGAAIASVSGTTVTFAGAHGLAIGQAITFGGEIRFVSALPGATAAVINAPFTLDPGAGAQLGTTVTYAPGNGLPTASIFDYWSPDTAVHRIVAGAVVNQVRIRVNGDFHEFEFRGPSKDLIDSASFADGEGALTAFPAEPAIGEFDSNVIPGHLGQVWLGAGPSRFYTLTDAEFTIDNNIDLRDREFGSTIPRCISPGRRDVGLSFSIHEDDSDATKALYQAARQRSPISVMFQLGTLPGQMFGIYIPNFIPEVPEFDDSASRLEWRFAQALAQGVVNDEVFIAFG
jgi:hypothetical protein